jgi:hypothetical protein
MTDKCLHERDDHTGAKQRSNSRRGPIARTIRFQAWSRRTVPSYVYGGLVADIPALPPPRNWRSFIKHASYVTSSSPRLKFDGQAPVDGARNKALSPAADAVPTRAGPILPLPRSLKMLWRKFEQLDPVVLFSRHSPRSGTIDGAG